ncbi:signal peptidase I [Mycolicibacterium cosmeticum]|uniref:Signal peptidase I n=1 Tax=Mycolicibacterium cosmeticum TaxID=258533 RepID=W9AX60_MYCCO|nr:signal peptidase I [Mycolicibacterium cosmeticum]CDO10419.1 signal peptidase I [Mycolicibacterium cosmeticum]
MSGPPRHRRLRRILRWVVPATALAAVLVLVTWALVLAFVGQEYRIPSVAMAPTVKPDDRVVVNKLAFRSHPPRPGDIVVLRAPAHWDVGYPSPRSANPVLRWTQDALAVFGFGAPDDHAIVTRVIAVGGQTVECRMETGVTVDGAPIAQPYLDKTALEVDPALLPCLGSAFGPVTVPAGRLWVMGDNRTHSADSRVYCAQVQAHVERGVLCTGDPAAGTVAVDDVIGLAWSVQPGGSQTR